MKEESRFGRMLRVFHQFFVFFLMVAFLITCCMMLFVSVLQRTAGIELTAENLGPAAKWTFLNVLLLSVFFTIVDRLRRKWTVERPARQILEAAGRLMQGDFSVRIKPMSGNLNDDAAQFHEIIACFNQLAEELAGVETLRTDFVANVSHEMKTPLAVMQNYGTLLQQPGLSEEQRLEYARGITDGARRLADMMTNILKLNRLENQQIYPQITEFDLGEQLCECLLQYETVWERAGIEIETEIADEVMVRADAELLSLVWNNLFSNAFKFTPAGGRVTLRLVATGNHAIVQVEDTGCGMSPEVGAHIFEKFYQGDSSHAVQGNGLGLALVKRVVDILQGEIGVQSTPGRGTIFTVRIRRR